MYSVVFFCGGKVGVVSGRRGEGLMLYLWSF